MAFKPILIFCDEIFYRAPGAVPTARSPGARGPGQRRPLLGVHLRPSASLLDEIQRHLGDQVVVGGAGEGLVRRLPQCQRVLPHVHQRQEAIPRPG